MVFQEGNIQNPVEGILNLPMAAGSVEEQGCIWRKSGDVVAGFEGSFLTNPTLADHFDDRMQGRPVVLATNVVNEGRVGNRPALTDFNTPLLLDPVLFANATLSSLSLLFNFSRSYVQVSGG
jgi:hypothetical protein